MPENTIYNNQLPATALKLNNEVFSAEDDVLGLHGVSSLANISIGNSSRDVSFGINTTSSGFAYGSGNTAWNTSAAFGTSNKAASSYAMATGQANTINSGANVALASGYGNTINVDSASALGNRLTIPSGFPIGTMATGRNNATSDNTLCFMVGNGTSESARHNAFAVGTDNSITVGDTKMTEAQLQELLAGGGGGEPEEYIKNASISGNTLTLVNKDDTTVEFTPEGGSSYTFTNGLTETDGTVSLAFNYSKGINNKYDTIFLACDDGFNSANLTKVNHGGIHQYDFYQNASTYDLAGDNSAFSAISSTTLNSKLEPKIGNQSVLVGRFSGVGHCSVGASSLIAAEKAVRILGYNSLAVGTGLLSTKFNASSETFLGKYNKDNIGTTDIFVIGNGTADNARHNAFAVGTDNSITVGDTKMTETQLQTLLAGGGGSSLYRHCLVVSGNSSIGQVEFYTRSSDEFTLETLTSYVNSLGTKSLCATGKLFIGTDRESITSLEVTSSGVLVLKTITSKTGSATNDNVLSIVKQSVDEV